MATTKKEQKTWSMLRLMVYIIIIISLGMLVTTFPMLLELLK